MWCASVFSHIAGRIGSLQKHRNARPCQVFDLESASLARKEASFVKMGIPTYMKSLGNGWKRSGKETVQVLTAA